MAYRSSTEEGYGIGVSTGHVDASHADRVDIADAELLFRGHFARSGPDLVLTGQDGHRLVVTGYFATEKHPDLVAPNGAHLKGDLVDLLAGSPTPGQYAQAKTTLPPEAIGKVEKVVGQVTLIHNGVAGPLHVGDPVYKSDVVQTGANSTCGIAFPDGTALDLVNNTRMALNEYNFEASNSASNGAVFSLVEGTFAFVAGQVAHTGEGMKINTPVATMGIRGTVGLFRSEPTVINSSLGHVWSVFLHEDIDGSHHLGRIALIDQDPNSPTFGQVFYLLDSSEYIAYLEPQGPGLPPHVRLEPMTNSKVFDDRHFYDDLGQIINAYQTGTVNPQSVPGTPGSGDNPSDLFQQQFQDEFGRPLFNSGKTPQGSGDLPFIQTPPPGFLPPPIPVMPGQNPNQPSNGPTPNGPTPNVPTPPASIHFVWDSTTAESWSQALADWNVGSAPNSPLDTVEIRSGTSIYDIGGAPTFISFLTVDPGATLIIKAGELVVGGLVDNGTIIVNSDPKFVINGSATIGSTHTLTVTGSGNEIDFSIGPTDNFGTIAARQGGVVDFNLEKVTNEAGAKMVASGHGSAINFLGVSKSSPDVVDNSSVMTARHGGNILFQASIVTNEQTGVISSVGRDSLISFGDELAGVDFTNSGKVVGRNGGTVAFFDATVDNKSGGMIEARRGGEVSFLNTNVTNESTALLAAIGCGALVAIGGDSSVTNAGELLAARDGDMQIGDAHAGSVQVENEAGGLIKADRGTISFAGVSFINDPTVPGAEDSAGTPGGEILSTNWGVISFHGGSFTNGQGALVEASRHGGIFFEGLKGNSLGVTNNGKFEATGCGSIIVLEGPNVSVTNDGGTFVAKHGGEIVFDAVSGVTNENGGKIEARDHGTVLFEGTRHDPLNVINTGATIAAIGCGSTVELADATINGGTLKTRDGGLIEAVAGHNEFLNVTLDRAVVQVDCRAVLDLNGGSSGIAATIDGDVTLRGDGLVTMAYQSYDIVAGTPRATLHNETTIVGAGTIGTGDGRLTLVNDGAITALYLGKQHGQFVIDTGVGAHGAATTINDGFIGAFGHKAVMLIENTTLDNCDGVIGALNHGTVELDGANISGGLLKTTDHGKIETVAGPGDTPSASTLDGVTIACGSHVEVGNHTTLTLTDGTTMFGGVLTVDRGGTLDIESHAGATLDGTIVHNHGTIEIDEPSHTTTLTLEDGAEIKGGTVSIGDKGILDIESRFGATLHHVDVDISQGGRIEIGETTAPGSILTLDDDTTIHGGTLVIERHSELDIEARTGATLDGTVVHNHGTIQVDEPTHTATLTLTDGAEIDGGKLSIGSHGVLDIESPVGATLDDVDVTMDRGGVIQVDLEAEATLHLGDGSSVTGGKLSIGQFGNVEIDRGPKGNGATLTDIDVVNDGTITFGAPHNGHDGGDANSDPDLMIGGVVTLEGTGKLILAGANDNITGAAKGGELDNNSNIVGDGHIGNGSDALKLVNESSGIVDASVVGERLVVDTGYNIIANAGHLESTGGILELRSDVANAWGVIGAYGSSALVKLFGVTITGGKIETGDPYWRDNGVIEVAAAGLAAITIFDGGQHHNPVTIAGFVEVDPNASLELKGHIDLAGGAIELDQSGRHGADLIISGHVTLTGYGDIALEGANTSIIGVYGSVSTLDNESTIIGARGGSIGDGGDSLIFINYGTVDSEAGHAGPLVIDTGSHAVVNTGILEATAASELDLYGVYENSGGTIKASAEGLTPLQNYSPTVVKLFDATIEGGKLVTDDPHSSNGGYIEIVATHGADRSIFDGSHGHAVTNDGYVMVDAGANLELMGTIHNHGTIEIDGKQTDLVIDGSVTLDGHGTILLDNANHPADQIVGGNDDDGNTLYNVDNTIEGAGNIGTGNGNFCLVNESSATIDANVDGQKLTIYTGHSIANAGVLEATNGGTLLVKDAVYGCDSGYTLIKGGTVEFDAAAQTNITFDNTTGFGQLLLKDWAEFAGQISGFGGSEPNAAQSDEIELLSFAGRNLQDKACYDSHTNITTLTIWNSKNSVSFEFVGDYTNNNTTNDFSVKQVGDNVLIFDPPDTGSPAVASTTPSVSVGGPGNDSFVFHPGEGTQTVNNFNAQHDTIELDHFGNIENMQELAAAITPDAHGNAVLELGHGDSIAIPGVSASFLQQHLQSMVHLHA